MLQMPAEDIRDQLRDNHKAVLAQVEALGNESDELRCHKRLEALHRAWLAHALAEETVVYHALDGVPATAQESCDAQERLVEHELLQCFFGRLSRTRPGTAQWFARLNVIGKLIRRRMEAEEGGLFARLARDFKAEDLSGMARDFGLARAKLTILEEAKAS